LAQMGAARCCMAVARWRQAAVTPKGYRDPKGIRKDAAVRLLGLALQRQNGDLCRASVRVWVQHWGSERKLVLQRGQMTMRSRVALHRAGEKQRAVAEWRLRVNVQGYMQLVKDISHEAACVLLWKFLSKRNANLEARSVGWWRVNYLMRARLVDRKQRGLKQIMLCMQNWHNQSPLQALQEWRINVGEDEKDLLFRAMRLEAGAKALAEFSRRQACIATARAVCCMRQQVAVGASAAAAQGVLLCRLTAQKNSLMSPDQQAERVAANKSAMRFVLCTMQHASRLRTVRLLRQWCFSSARKMKANGAREEAERSALLFRKCKLALQDGDQLRRQLKVVRGAYLMVVVDLLRVARVQVEAARGLAEWRHAFWDDAVAASLDRMLPNANALRHSMPQVMAGNIHDQNLWR